MTDKNRDTKRIIGVVALGFVAIVVMAKLTDDPSRRPKPTAPLDASADAAEAGASACTMPSYDEAMSLGRKGTEVGQWAGAFAAYRKAIRARPFDAAAWRWSGHARAVVFDELALRDLEVARALTKDPSARIAILLDEARVYEHAHDATRARIALARAEVLGSAEAGEKLGPGSHCTATVDRKPFDLDFARSWHDVLGRMVGPGCEIPDADDEAAARALACGGCENGRWKKGTCDGEGPWTIAMGTKDCVQARSIITPYGAGRWWVESKPAEGSRLERAGKRILQRTTNETTSPIVADENARYLANGWEPGGCRADEKAEIELAKLPGCAPAKGVTFWESQAIAVFDEGGKHLVTVRAFDPQVSLELADDVVTAAGGGCALRVDVAGK